MSENKFYLRWILANSIGEAIGLGTTFSLGMLFAPFLTQDHHISVTLAKLLISHLAPIHRYYYCDHPRAGTRPRPYRLIV
jgi:hypothetical protein